MIKLKEYGRLYRRIFYLSFKFAPARVTFDVVLAVLSGLKGVLSIYALTTFFNSIEMAIHGDCTKNRVLYAFILYISVQLISLALMFISDYNSGYMSEKFSLNIKKYLHNKAGRINAIDFEDPDLLKTMDKASGGTYSVYYVTMNILSFFVCNIPYIIYVGIYLYYIYPPLFFLPIIIFIPVIIEKLNKTNYLLKVKDEHTALSRRLSYYRACMTDRAYVKQTRTLGGVPFFSDLYHKTRDQLNHENIKNRFIVFKRESVSQTCTLLGYCGVLLFLFGALARGRISASGFAAVFASVDALYKAVEYIVNNRLSSIISDDIPDVRAVLDFLDLPESQWGNETNTAKETIELHDVSFRYAGRDTDAVKHINLSIKKGELLAIVGENGSGKTTLGRLILGIYEPGSGVVKVNGMPGSSYTKEARYANLSAVFQNYYKYLFNLKMNVSISQMVDMEDTDKLIGSFEKSGVRYNDMRIYPNHIDTKLSKEYGGVDLSGGEWQCVALARGFFRDADLILLDEPTASIDPIEESMIYRRFAEVAKSMTEVCITHRLGATKLAERIIVLDHGEIVEEGNHETLMQLKGKYYSLYTSQAQWYI